MYNIYRKNYGLFWHSYYRLHQKIGLLKPPRYVQWVATHRCNFKCEHCGTSAGKKLPNELTAGEISDAVLEMGKMGVLFLSVTGGEPLLRKDLFKVLHLAKSKGMGVGFVTNGSLVENYEDEIRELKPNSMTVSIDGIPDTHNSFRKTNTDFKKILGSVKFLRDAGTKIVGVTTTVHRRNLAQLEDVRRIVMESGANYWRINLPILEGRAKNNPDALLSNEEIREIFDYIAKTRKATGYNMEICEGAGHTGSYEPRIKNAPFFCGCGWNTCTIMADGEVMGCPVFDKPKEEVSEGNIRDTSFKWIWENKFQRFRNLKLDDTCNACKYLHACRGGCWIMRNCNKHCLKEVWAD